MIFAMSKAVLPSLFNDVGSFHYKLTAVKRLMYSTNSA